MVADLPSAELPDADDDALLLAALTDVSGSSFEYSTVLTMLNNLYSAYQVGKNVLCFAPTFTQN